MGNKPGRRTERPERTHVYAEVKPHGRRFVGDDVDIDLTIPHGGNLVASQEARIRLKQSSNYLSLIQNSGLDDILTLIRVIDCKPDNLQFRGQADVTVHFKNVLLDGNFILFGLEKSLEAEGTWAWQDLSETCDLRLMRSSSRVSFKLEHFSEYILIALIGSVALSSASKLLLDCLNGKSFPCSFTPFIGKVSGKKHPLTIVCKEGHNTTTSTPKMYQRFGLVRTSEFNIFDEDTLTVEIRHADLVEECSKSYQINRATCKTEEGQAMDLIVKPAEHEELLAGQAEIFVRRFFFVKKVCSMNFTIIIKDEQCLPAIIHQTLSPRRPSHERFDYVPGVRKYFFFIKEKVSSDWKDLAFFLGFDDAAINNIAGRNPDDKSRCMDMLQVWQRSQGFLATIEVLMEALSKAGLQNVVDVLTIEFPGKLFCVDELFYTSNAFPIS
ncbi:uncharacterized protein [Branchiostoma lanceolatum]|uniref:uncharacterized protein n=1 Tax=Branchiostoma lanceolatum TaxID=7740 RepID=UPI0034518F20